MRLTTHLIALLIALVGFQAIAENQDLTTAPHQGYTITTATMQEHDGAIIGIQGDVATIIGTMWTQQVMTASIGDIGQTVTPAIAQATYNNGTATCMATTDVTTIDHAAHLGMTMTETGIAIIGSWHRGAFDAVGWTMVCATDTNTGMHHIQALWSGGTAPATAIALVDHHDCDLLTT